MHIAVIMDGNRRWAKERGLQVSAGHKAGIDALEKLVKGAVRSSIKYLTIYALSTENFTNRDKLELRELFSILQAGFVEKLPILEKEGVRVKFIGQTDELPLMVRTALQRTEQRLKNGQKLELTIALNYGSRAEIVAAASKIAQENISEAAFAKELATAPTPNPDLVIRTGGQQRLSNFLLWQAAYSELYFTEQLWPDFDENSLQQALKEYSKRKRNFGA